MDTLQHICNFPDTLRIINVISSDNSLLDWKTLIAVFLGGTIAILGNFILSLIQKKSDLHKAFFEHHLTAYEEFSTLCWKGYSVVIKDDEPNGDNAYPKAYEKYDSLKKWVAEMVSMLDRLLIFFDVETYRSFTKLNALVIMHLRTLRASETQHTIDLATRNLGRKDVEEIQKLTLDVLNSCRKYLRDTYDAPLTDLKE